MRILGRATWGLIFSVFLLTLTGHAYEVKTHAEISRTAAERSSLPEVLPSQLGLSNGLKHVVNGQRIEQWIQEGSIREDDFLRFRNHFHDPLAAQWSQAGLLHFFESSLLWAQDTSGLLFTNGWAWPEARDYFYQGLTAPSSDTREENLGKTFRALGQVIHLIQDATERGQEAL